MVTEPSEKPPKNRPRVALPTPNLDLFSDHPETQPTETTTGKGTGRLGPAIRRLQLKLRMATDKALADEQLTTAQFGALSALERHPGATSAALSRTAGVTAQTMHEIIRLLSARGLIDRTQDPEHGRKLQQQISADGRKRLQQARRRVERVEEKLAAPLKPHERMVLQSLLERCSEGL